jgi:hypothetical protein
VTVARSSVALRKSSQGMTSPAASCAATSAVIMAFLSLFYSGGSRRY